MPNTKQQEHLLTLHNEMLTLAKLFHDERALNQQHATGIYEGTQFDDAYQWAVHETSHCIRHLINQLGPRVQPNFKPLKPRPEPH